MRPDAIGRIPSTASQSAGTIGRFPVLNVERTYRSGRLIIRQGLWTDNRIRGANGGLQAKADKGGDAREEGRWP